MGKGGQREVPKKNGKIILKDVEDKKTERPGILGFTTGAHAINLHKFLTPFFVLGSMYYHNNFSQPAYLYLMLHGLYCIMWLMKDRLFPDKNFDVEMESFGAFLFVHLLCDLYWLGPYFLTKYRFDAAVSNFELCSVMFCWGLGIFLVYLADSQKYWILKYEKRLIDDGFFSYIRNVNYLGETLIYVAFAMLTKHMGSWLVLAFFVFCFFLPNMLKKDKSLSKYPDFKDYKARTWLFVPLIL